MRTDGTRLRSIDATLALTRRGVPMLAAKRAVEALYTGLSAVHVPTMDDLSRFAVEMHKAGVLIHRVEREPVLVAAE